MTAEERLAEIYEQGALISYMDFPVITGIGYYALWPERHMLFWCELGDASTGNQHMLRFDRLDDLENQVTLYLAGELVAGIAPFHEWPEEEGNLAQWITAWQQFQQDPEKDLFIAHCKRIGEGWRRGENI